jgi:ribosomal protein L20
MTLTAEQIQKNDKRIARRCPSCFGDMDKHEGRADYQELYLTILKIGQSRVNHGMTYSDLIQALDKEGFNIDNGCLKQAVKKWFHDAYFHITVEGKACNLDELDEHSDCTFILKGESSLLLLEHEKINKTITLARNAIIVALIVGAITVFVSWYIAVYPNLNAGTGDATQKVQVSPKVQIPIFRQRL